MIKIRKNSLSPIFLNEWSWEEHQQIKEMQDRIKRLEYWIVGGMGAVLIVLLTDIA